MRSTIGTRPARPLMRAALAGLVMAHLVACGPSKGSADPSAAAASPAPNTKVDASSDASADPESGALAEVAANPRRAPAGTVAKCGADLVERVRDIGKVGEDGPFHETRTQRQGIADSLQGWDAVTLAPPALGRDELAALGGTDGASIRAEGVDIEYTFDAEGLPSTARVFSAGREEQVEQTWTYVRQCSVPAAGAVLQLMAESTVELSLGGARQTLGQKFTAAIAFLDEPPEVVCDPASGGGWACGTAAAGMQYSVTVVEVDEHWLKIKPETVDVIDDD